MCSETTGFGCKVKNILIVHPMNMCFISWLTFGILRKNGNDKKSSFYFDPNVNIAFRKMLINVDLR